MLHVRFPKDDCAIPRVAGSDDLERICATLRKGHERLTSGNSRRGTCRRGKLSWYVDMWRFALYSGLRIREFARIKWQHVDSASRLLYLYEQKSGKQDTVPPSRMAVHVLSGIQLAGSNTYVFGSPHAAATDRNVDYFCNRADVKEVPGGSRNRRLKRRVHVVRRERGHWHLLAPLHLRRTLKWAL
jgi:integrase